MSKNKISWQNWHNYFYFLLHKFVHSVLPHPLIFYTFMVSFLHVTLSRWHISLHMCIYYCLDSIYDAECVEFSSENVWPFLMLYILSPSIVTQILWLHFLEQNRFVTGAERAWSTKNNFFTDFWDGDCAVIIKITFHKAFVIVLKNLMVWFALWPFSVDYSQLNALSLFPLTNAFGECTLISFSVK